MSSERKASLFRNGRNQAIRIPKEFELPGVEATITRQGNQLIISPVQKPALLGLLESWQPLDFDLPDADASALPLDDVDL